MAQKKKVLSRKIYGGGVALTALTLAFSGILFSNDSKRVNSAPMFSQASRSGIKILNSSGGISKKLTRTTETFRRTISDVSGNKSDPIPEKRFRVEMTTSSSTFTFGNNPDTWIMQNKNDGVIFTSKEQPRILQNQGSYVVFSTTDKDGLRSMLSVDTGSSTNWYQNKDIFWTNTN